MKHYKSILQFDTSRCAICGVTGKLDWHHIRCGNQSREKSEKWGLMLALCRKCHTNLHSNAEVKKEWQEIAQAKFLLLYGREIWMKEFKKDYLWREEENGNNSRDY